MMSLILLLVILFVTDGTKCQGISWQLIKQDHLKFICPPDTDLQVGHLDQTDKIVLEDTFKEEREPFPEKSCNPFI